LVFNCHEAWIHELRWLPWQIDLITDLPGRAVRGWDTAMRPLPAGARVISLEEARTQGGGWHCILCHNVSDLLAAKDLRGPRLMVIHVTLEGRMQEEQPRFTATEMQAQLLQYCQLNHVHLIAVSALKGRSWGFHGDLVRLAVNVEDYPQCTGTLSEGIRVSNLISVRPKILLWDFHRAAFEGLPIKLVGRNPDMPGVEPSRDWAELKSLLAERRFFIHTAATTMEDGYNLATLEAMATGLPVLGNRHPTSPVEDGVSGFLSDDPAQLRGYAVRLLEDRELALRMGQAARARVHEQFGVDRFRDGMVEAVEKARALYKSQYARKNAAKPRPRKR